jgi:hypothetical protein
MINTTQLNYGAVLTLAEAFGSASQIQTFQKNAVYSVKSISNAVEGSWCASLDKMMSSEHS